MKIKQTRDTLSDVYVQSLKIRNTVFVKDGLLERVRAEGKVIHCGRQLATAEARLVGPDGTLYAHATTTCLVFDLPSA